MSGSQPYDIDGLAAAMAALPDRRDFAFSAEIGRVAWIDDAAVEWLDDDAPGRLGRFVFPEPLPAPVQLEIVTADLMGLCRPTAAGLEVIAVDVDPAAVDVTLANAEANAVELDVRHADALAGDLPSAEVAVANVSLEVVRAVAPRLAIRHLVTSGYLASDELRLDRFTRRRRVTEAGWAAEAHEK